MIASHAPGVLNDLAAVQSSLVLVAAVFAVPIIVASRSALRERMMIVLRLRLLSPRRGDRDAARERLHTIHVERSRLARRDAARAAAGIRVAEARARRGLPVRQYAQNPDGVPDQGPLVPPEREAPRTNREEHERR
jgi:hypothetical protein